MTPFGAKIRELRTHKGVTLKNMADDLGVSSAYLSSLEHGYRGLPGPGLFIQICAYFGLIWDEAEALKRLSAISRPRVAVRTGGLSPKATELANLLARHIQDLDEGVLDELTDIIKATTSDQEREPE
jgi:transcriptional regulator with XRE-family HTH domain